MKDDSSHKQTIYISTSHCWNDSSVFPVSRLSVTLIPISQPAGQKASHTAFANTLFPLQETSTPTACDTGDQPISTPTCLFFTWSKLYLVKLLYVAGYDGYGQVRAGCRIASEVTECQHHLYFQPLISSCFLHPYN